MRIRSRYIDCQFKAGKASIAIGVELLVNRDGKGAHQNVYYDAKQGNSSTPHQAHSRRCHQFIEQVRYSLNYQIWKSERCHYPTFLHKVMNILM